MKLNIGCGGNKLEGYINIDAFPGLNPDLLMDVSTTPLPQKDGEVEEIICYHTLEHIEPEKHPFVLGEINRVLQLDGSLYLSFPDGKKVCENYLENKWGMRREWARHLVGRGTTIWDCHRTVIFVDDLIPQLNSLGFGHFKVMEEVGQSHNAFIMCKKIYSVVERKDLIRKEVVEHDATQRSSVA